MIYPKESIKPLSEQSFAFITIEEKDHILCVTLNRPQKKNAMNPTMMQEIAYAYSYAKYTSSVWTVVLKANGDVFCAGADLKAFAGQATDTGISTIPPANGEILLGEVFNKVYKPCIAVVEAPVYAGGFLLICGCHYVIATDDATFSLPEARRGIWPMQVMQSLMNVLTPRQLLDLCITSKKLTAKEAFDIGLVTHLVDKEGVEVKLLTLIDQIKQNSPSAIRLGLMAYDELKSVPESNRHAYLKEKLNEILLTQDAKEGIAAFSEKRAPHWTGR
jgi:enoyl-CoA hydratase/carnithine racemase